MRRKSQMKIEKFVDLLILNTPKKELTKTRDELIKEVKLHWRKQGKTGQQFINKALKGDFLVDDK